MRTPSCRGAAVACLVLAACVAPVPASRWTIQVSATAGAALVLAERGDEVLRIACRRNPADLLLVTPRLAGRAGPVRLQVGTTAFDLHADADVDGSVLSASGPPSGALSTALFAGGAVSVSQGGASAAFPAPDPATARAFAAACRHE